MRNDGSSKGTVAVVTHEHDLHAHAIRRELAQRHNITCHIFETDHFGRGPGMSWSSVTGDHGAVFPDLEGDAVRLADVDAIWFRRMGNRRSSAYDGMTDEAYADLIHNDTTSAILGALMTGFRGAWVDHPVAARNAENKVLQLHTAREAGFRVPRTLISQDPARIREFCAELNGNVIVKPVRGTPKAPMVTTKVVPELLENDAAMLLSPAIYQECVPGPRHVRAHVFGGRVMAALIESEELDWRPNLNVPVREIELPAAVEDALRAVCKALNLSMGIFDLKIDDAGEYLWLEVNPQGQFLFIEGLCGLPLTEAMGSFLADAAVGARC